MVVYGGRDGLAFNEIDFDGKSCLILFLKQQT